MHTNLKAHFALLLVAILYGANYSVAKGVMQNGLIHPFTFILIRIFSGMAFFFLLHSLFVKEKVKRNDMPLMILCGLFGVAINQMFFFSGLQETTPIHAALIMITTPLIVMVITAIFYKNTLTKINILGLIIGCIGAFFLITEGQELNLNSTYFTGDIKIFINAVSYAFYLVLVKKLLRKYNPFTITKWIFFVGFIMVLPFGFDHFRHWDRSVLDTTHYLAILYVIIGTTIMAYLFNAFALSKLKPTTVGAYIYLQPLIAGFISISWGQDELTFTKSIAGALIFMGVIIASLQKTKPKSTSY